MSIATMYTKAPPSAFYYICDKLFYNLRDLSETDEIIEFTFSYYQEDFLLTIAKGALPGKQRTWTISTLEEEEDIFKRVIDKINAEMYPLTANGFIKLAEELVNSVSFSTIVEVYRSLPTVYRAISAAIPFDLTAEMSGFIREKALTTPVVDNSRYNKIAVIKAVRDKYGCSLLKCKFYVEWVME